MANEHTKEFLGRGWSFPPKFERNDEVLELQMVSLEEDIRESLSILLSTLPGERVMQPTFGCGLNALVFENITESSVTKIKELVERAILFFETRNSNCQMGGVESYHEGKVSIFQRLRHTARISQGEVDARQCRQR